MAAAAFDHASSDHTLTVRRRGGPFRTEREPRLAEVVKIVGFAFLGTR
jgi:hypothetical protein